MCNQAVDVHIGALLTNSILVCVSITCSPSLCCVAGLGRDDEPVSGVMRWLVLVWLGWAGLTLSPALAFSLPRPLDNMYQEVVRFYKRVRHEGGQYN